jgi:acyl dehydratase
MTRTDLYLDDFKIGDRFESARYTITEEDVLEFGKRYDPQAFHIDREAAKKTIHGGLIASGFQTLALGFRLLHYTGIVKGANLGGFGVDELRWHKPVRPGDTLRSVVEVAEIIPSKSKPDRGVFKRKITVFNQNDEPVLTGIVITMMKRKRD